MVKNSTGGGKAKGFARKNLLPSHNYKLRVSQDHNEIYAVVSKMLGNGRCYVNAFINDINTQLICVIRAKFTGRSKRANFISVGQVVLIGIRDWQSNSNTCDLLDIYDSNDIDALTQIPGFNFPGFHSFQDSLFNNLINDSNLSSISTNLEHHDDAGFLDI